VSASSLVLNTLEDPLKVVLEIQARESAHHCTHGIEQVIIISAVRARMCHRSGSWLLILGMSDKPFPLNMLRARAVSCWLDISSEKNKVGTIEYSVKVRASDVFPSPRRAASTIKSPDCHPFVCLSRSSNPLCTPDLYSDLARLTTYSFASYLRLSAPAAPRVTSSKRDWIWESMSARHFTGSVVGS